MTCPLCLNIKEFASLKGPDNREYYCCPHCMLIFVPDNYLPSPENEKKRYLLHENTPENKGYTGFLCKAVDSVKPILEKGMRLLDFGCGPNPVLSFLLAGEGFPCLNYDPFFYPEMPKGKFNLLFSIETFEHFFRPAPELEHIHKILENSGFLLVMTSVWTSFEMFNSWSYARDFTHVRFYHEKSFDYIAGHFGFRRLKIEGSGIFLFQKI